MGIEKELTEVILTREKIRGKILESLNKRKRKGEKSFFCLMLMMHCEILDNYLMQKIETDKILEGILKDIQGNIAGINLAQGDINTREEIKSTFDETDPANPGQVCQS